VLWNNSIHRGGGSAALSDRHGCVGEYSIDDLAHYKGQRYYGNTKHGAYVRAAAAAKSVLAKSNSA
jgi:hypothetical protein